MEIHKYPRDNPNFSTARFRVPLKDTLKNQAATGKWFCSSAQALQALGKSRKHDASSSWQNMHWCWMQLHYPTHNPPHVRKPGQNSLLVCHCCHVALKLCTSALLLPQQRGLKRVHLILDHFACRCITWNILPDLIQTPTSLNISL